MSNAESVVAMMNQISPKHKWDDEQRSTLAVLEKFYAVPKSVQAKVFNKIYWQTLYHEGFTNGLTPEALVSQIADLKHSPRGEIFRYLLTCGPQHAYCRRLKDKIEAVAGILNIALQPRRPTSGSFSGLQVLTASASYNHIESPPTKRGRLVRDSESCSSSTESLAEPSGCDFDSDSDSDTECSETIWVANSSDSSLDEFEEDSLESETHRVNPRLRIKRDHHNRKIHSRPRLLFRAFRPSHNLKARRFLGTPSTSIPSPPAYGSREFEEEVLRHLSADSTFNSPWLSFTASLDRALKIITSAKHVLHLAVVDYNVLEEGLKDRVGDHDKIWLVPVLCKEAKDDRLRNLRKVDDEISTRSLPAYNGRDEVYTVLSRFKDIGRLLITLSSFSFGVPSLANLSDFSVKPRFASLSVLSPRSRT